MILANPNFDSENTGMKREHGQLAIAKDDCTCTAILSDDLIWSCDNDELQQYLSQLGKLYTNPVVRKIMQATKRDLEYRGLTVELDQSSNSVISDIIKINDDIRTLWSNAHGWAPTDAAELLAKSRLDWQVSLSHCLMGWLGAPSDENHDGRLILAWVNLGCLVEGTLKFFLSVYKHNYLSAYKDDSEVEPQTQEHCKKPRDIDCLKFEPMKQFFAKHVWTGSQGHWTDWLSKVQGRRNAVHAYKDRDIGTFDEFFAEVAAYLDLLIELEGQVPAP